MIYFVSSFSFFILRDTSEFLCKLLTSYICRVHGMFKKCMNRIFSRPCDKHLVDLTRISLSMFIFSYPDTDIELSWFKYPYSSSTDKSIWYLIQDEVLELFSSRYFLFWFSHVLKLFFIARNLRCDIEIFIGFRELDLKLIDIDSTISWERHKYTPESLDMRNSEIEMGIFEKIHYECVSKKSGKYSHPTPSICPLASGSSVRTYFG